LLVPSGEPVKVHTVDVALVLRKTGSAKIVARQIFRTTPKELRRRAASQHGNGSDHVAPRMLPSTLISSAGNPRFCTANNKIESRNRDLTRIGSGDDHLTRRVSITYKSGNKCAVAAHPLLNGRHVLVQNRTGFERVRLLPRLRK
jgi:hypothetical protein